MVVLLFREVWMNLINYGDRVREGLSPWVRLPLVFLALGYTVYAAITNSGIYGYFADLQMEWFGGYHVVITFLITLGVCSIPVVCLFYLSLKFGVCKRATKVRRLPWTAADVNRAFPYILGVGFIVGGLLAGGFFVVRGLAMGPLQRVELVSLSTQSPESRYVEVAGHLKFDRAVTYAKDELTYSVIPLVPAGWDASKPVTVLVKVFKEWIDVDAHLLGLDEKLDPQGLVSVKGLLSTNDLSHHALYSVQPALILASPYYVLDYTWSAHSDTRMGWGMLIGMVCAGLIILGLWRWYCCRTVGD
ncbi:MAG TPA: hypothetical protein VJC18_08665 [bacterium]|nr:hypothetical protein [bacterium]